MLAVFVSGLAFMVFSSPVLGATIPGAPQPSVTLGDIPRRISDFINRSKQAIAARLKIAQDVAIKSALRVFYQQLAMQTFLYISREGKGESPLFITNPHYFQNVFNAAQNDFLDNLEKEYFGQVVTEPGTPGEKRLIYLFAKGILDPGTAAEANCNKANDLEQKDIKEIEDDLKIIKTADPNLDVICPITVTVGDDPLNPIVTFDRGEGSSLDAKFCIEQLEPLITSMKQQAADRLRQCMRAAGDAKRQKRAATRSITDLNKLTSNEQVAVAVSDIFTPEENGLGTLIHVLARAQEAGALKASAEEVAARDTNILGTRTLAGEIIAPGSLTQKYSEQGIQKATENVQFATGSYAADLVLTAAGDAIMLRIAKWLRNQCLLNPPACKKKATGSTQSRLLFGGISSGAAELTNFAFGKPDIVAGDPSRTAISTVDQLESIGVIDQRFRQAIEQKLTVREALDQGLLDPNRTFGFDSSGQEPIDGYPYRSLLYLRTARVIPVGWELAAKFMKLQGGIGGNIGFGELIDQFNICGQDAEHDYVANNKQCSSGSPNPGLACTTDAECGVNQAQIDAGEGCKDKYDASPFCGLVDPDWVLKAPFTYCRKEGAGEEVITRTFICDEDTNGNGRVDCTDQTRSPLGGDFGRFEIQRKTEVCVDQPSCIAENEDGSCRAYGYCFEELPTFRFDGTLCPSYYASCQAFTDSLGQRAAYLTKTIDRNGCSADNAGCSAYCGDRKDSDKSWLCRQDASAVTCPSGQTCTCRQPNGESCTIGGGAGTCETPSGQTCTLGKNFTYFDRDVETCDSSDEGCREYISMASGANLLANGGFELYSGTPDDNSDDTVRGWGAITGLITTARSQVVTTTSGIGASNAFAVKLPGTASANEGMAYTNDRTPPGLDTGRPVKSQTLTLSFYGKAISGSWTGRFGFRNPDDVRNPTGPAYLAEDLAEYTTDWKRFTLSANAPEGVYDNDKYKQYVQPFIRSVTCNVGAGENCDVIIDNVQLEIGLDTSGYKEYGLTGAIDLNNNRRSCERVDVSCEKYAPAAGGDAITGVVNWPNRCAKEDVGCRAYRKEAIDHIPFRPAVDPINLVASSGTTCQASEVGCEEYTNLDVAAQGGEAKEYYTGIQQCVKPADGPSQATYFTWVGDDRSGFQLKSFRLKASNIANYAGEGGPAPCTNLQAATSADDNNPACEDSATAGDPKFIALCASADIGVNPDCTQYFDGTGHVFYRLRSRTIPVSEECRPYRNTIDQQGVCQGGTTPGNACSTVADCRGVGATCAPIDRFYLILRNQSAQCSPAAARCRAFTGNTGQNTRTIFSDTFEGTNVVTNAWMGIGPGTVALSSESLVAGGHSMDASGAFGTQPAMLQDKINGKTSYLLSFWAKPNSATKIEQAFIQVGSTTYPLIDPARQLSLAAEWHAYNVGPVTIDADPAGQSVQLGLVAKDAGGNDARAFIDNVVLQEITDRAFLIDGSFHTCADSELGCEAYTDRQNQPQYLKSFTRLCNPDNVGCSAMFDTQNSSNPFLSDPVRGVAVPGDTTADFIDETNVRCSAAAKGCTAFGQPAYDVNKKIGSYQTVYLKDQPDNHPQILCTAEEQFCSEYTSTDGSRWYFKDPGAQTCEFKRLGGDRDFHWYIRGTSVRCPTLTPPAEGVPTGRACVKSCSGGARQGLACTGDSDCPVETGKCTSNICVGGTNSGQPCANDAACPPESGLCTGNDANVGRQCTLSTAGTDCLGGNICDLWTGACPEEQSGCNEYRDPSDPNPCRSSCPLEQSRGKPTPVNESCQPTFCVNGAKDGDSCSTNADCPGKCDGGTKDGAFCASNADCSGGGQCNKPEPGQCSDEGIPGCRSYTYLRQTVEENAQECNGIVDLKLGCRPFNDTSNPTLNFRAF